MKKLVSVAIGTAFALTLAPTTVIFTAEKYLDPGDDDVV